MSKTRSHRFRVVANNQCNIRSLCVIMSNSMAIDQTVAEIWQFFDFSKFRPSTILDHRCARFGWNRWSGFNKMQLLIFNEFGLKMPVHATKIVFGGFYPLNGDHCNLHPKRHSLAAPNYTKTNLFRGMTPGAYSILQMPSLVGRRLATPTPQEPHSCSRPCLRESHC